MNVHGHDLKALHLFCDEYPEATPLVLYLGKERRKVDGIDCIPLREFLLRLHPERAID